MFELGRFITEEMKRKGLKRNDQKLPIIWAMLISAQTQKCQ
jgi:hypothetical protein